MRLQGICAKGKKRCTVTTDSHPDLPIAPNLLDRPSNGAPLRPVEPGQYASQDFSDVLRQYGFTASTSRRGNCWANACSETLFGSLNVKRLQGQGFVTRRQAKDEVIAWLLRYDQTRMHSTLAYVSPIRFVQDWLAAQAMQVNS